MTMLCSFTPNSHIVCVFTLRFSLWHDFGGERIAAE